jgi:hypothetical protein
MARPTKFNDERAELICVALRKGGTRKAACDVVGVSQDSFARWLDRYADFADLVKRAEAEAEAEMVGAIHAASKETWQAAAWWLERRRNEDWGRKDTVRFEKMNDAQLREYLLGRPPGDDAGAVGAGGGAQGAGPARSNGTNGHH